ncbi:Succinyl-CoA:(R)-benzylsuccinate CoA-transferase subunit BbsE [subsurface metagenome]
MAEKTEGMLSPYRVLDLTDEKGLLCGKILGDLGADVIKIERPGGDPARSLGPFYHDEPDPEKSLFWFALNTSKRGITLNIEAADGQEIFKRLVKSADFVVESFPLGYMDKLGLGYSDLEKINSGVIMVSITPFGQTGPYKDWKTSDIVAWALGGDMAPYGDADRPPVRISHHSQAYLHAGADGAMGALTALYHRWSTGEGLQVDVSIHEAAVHSSIHNNPVWSKERPIGKRGEELFPGAGHRILLWPCKDGYVSWSHGGPSRLGPSLPLIKWMESEGVTNDFLRGFNWNRPDFMRISQEEMDQIDEPTAKFFMSHTKAELLEGAVKRQVMLYPVATTADMLENVQLIDRGFWVEVEHPELGTTITYPGAFGCSSEMSPRISRRAPLIGEHNQEIYEQELGFSREKLVILKQAGVI